MKSNISYDPALKLFVLRTQRSYYAMRIAEDGQLLHLGSGAVPEDSPETWAWSNLGVYSNDQGWGWEYQCESQELPAFGDINYHDVALKVLFNEPDRQPIRDVRLRYAGHTIRQDSEPWLAPEHGIAPQVTNARETLLITLQDTQYDFRVTMAFRITPEHDVLERWLHLENRSACDITIESLAFGCLNLPRGNWEVTHAAGQALREFVPVRHKLIQGTFRLDQRGLNTGHASSPAFLLSRQGEATENAGEVWFGALAYSGNWNLRFNLLPTGSLRVFGGYEPDDFGIHLKPGDSHLTPVFLHGCAGDGRGGASLRLHGFCRERILPAPRHEELRPVLYNSWEATYFDVTEAGQAKLARIAADLGVELFCVDDGWFGDRTDDTKGLGDWTPRPEAFPRGLKPLADEVHRLGMKFGIWVEPEMVNPNSDLYRAHPDWVLHFPDRPRTESRNQLILDFGRPEVIEYIFNALDRLVRENDVDFFKWDMNRYATEPGSVAGVAIWQAHVSALYNLMDRLRRNHPRLSIQSCSGGGGRVDMGILARTDQVWTSDNTDAHDRTLIQEGFSMFYPPRVMESWVTHEKNHQTGRIASLDLRFDVAMRGALGLGLDLDRLSPAEFDACKRKIAFYKQIRPVIQNGNLHRLANLFPDSGFSIWLSVSPDRQQAVYSFVRLHHLRGQFMAPVRLRGLDENAIYAVIDESGEEQRRFSGAQLMFVGLPANGTNGRQGETVRSSTLLLKACH